MPAQPVTFAVEDVQPLIPEVLPMAQAARLSDPFDLPKPSVRWLLERRAAGWVLHTMRRGGDLAGICWARRLPHDGAQDSGMFIKPEHRGSPRAALDFSRFVEASMRALGARWMVWECDEFSSALAKRRGLEAVSTRYVSRFKE